MMNEIRETQKKLRDWANSKLRKTTSPNQQEKYQMILEILNGDVVVVPREPSGKMYQAAVKAMRDLGLEHGFLEVELPIIYKAMIAAVENSDGMS